MDIDSKLISSMVAEELGMDIGSGDIHQDLMPGGLMATAKIMTRQDALICGQAWFDETFNALSDQIVVHWLIEEGHWAQSDEVIAEVRGPASVLLSAERTALNFLQTLSAVATKTAQMVRLAGDTCQVLDTRKTIPLWRMAQKYAVRCGGGYNHRLGLYDAFLIKENHIAACGGIRQAVNRARKIDEHKLCQVEVESLVELQEAVECGADWVLLDNFNIEEIKGAVTSFGNAIKIEASGGIDESNIKEIAQTGVNRISIGALTKHIEAVDLSMRLSYVSEDQVLLSVK